MTAQEIKDTGQRLFKARQYAEALPLLKSAAEAFPENEVLWQELVLAASWTKQNNQAVEFAKQAIHQHPRSDWLWRQLGNELTVCGRLDEADNALSNSQSLNPKSEWLWRYYAALHKKRENLEKEIEAWEQLHALGAANSNDLNSLGIAYYNHKNLAKALEIYRLSAKAEPSAYPFFNIGQVFNDPEISQDADAVDAYRRALVLMPDHERAKERLEAAKRKLAPLAERARTLAAGLVQSDELFQFYISPFEMLQIKEIKTVDELDVKAIQRATKRLLQEIDINDGKIPWLDDYPLDKSRALAMEDELHDKTKRGYHLAVFHNKRLLQFLTRGDIEHFLYSDGYFPGETLAALDDDPKFRAFLSEPFARQYNVVLARAIERRLLVVVEVLFDGRRWVEPKDDDVCFQGASKRVNDLVAQMRTLAEQGKKQRVAFHQIQNLISETGTLELFNLLPTAFRSEQSQLVGHIRSLAIDSYNEHSDSKLSYGILGLCKQFKFKNADLKKRLEEDSKAIEKILAENTLAENRSPPISDKRTVKKTGKGWFVAAGIVTVMVVIRMLDSSNTSSSNASPTRSPVTSPPNHTASSLPVTPNDDSKTIFHIPSYATAELDRDSKAIDIEKAKFERMATQSKNLGRQIERARLSLDQTSQLAIDQFNTMVNSYNALLEDSRAQDRHVNQMITNYNAKLRKYDR